MSNEFSPKRMDAPQPNTGRKPADATFERVPPTPEPPADYYTTGGKLLKFSSRHPLLLLVLLLLCIVFLLLALFFRIERESIPLTQPLSFSEDVQPLPDSTPMPENSRTTEIPLCVSEPGEELTMSQIYSKVMASTATLIRHKGSVQEYTTAIVLTESGYILAHTIYNGYADYLQVQLENGEIFDASFVGADRDTELLLLKIEAHDLVATEFGDATALAVGDEIYIIGNPFGQEMPGTMLKGNIAAISPEIAFGDSFSATVLQTNLPMLSKDAGALVLNTCGQVVGFGVAEVVGYESYATVPNIGFAISVNDAMGLLNDTILHGNVSAEVTLNIEVYELTAPQRNYLGLPEGVMIDSVTPNGNAAAAGLQNGDLLVRIEGIPITTVGEYLQAVNACRYSDVIRVTIYRNGNYYYTDILLSQDAAE